MNTSSRGFWAIVIIIVLVIIAIFVIYTSSGMPSTPQNNAATAGQTQNVEAVFTCDGGKSINAMFMNATTATTTGNSVMLALSDGRQMTLPQTISADGARYANADESLVFWNKGNGAFIQENNTTTYNNCVTSTQ